MLLLLSILACVPVLHSPGGDDTGAGDCPDLAGWAAPENSWVSATPDQCLTGEGFDRGETIPDARLADQHGDEVAMWQFYGNVVLLDVSTMWCAPCAQLADEVDAVWKDYEDQGFIYVTLLPQDVSSNQPDNADLNSWASDHAITAPVLSTPKSYGDQIVGQGEPYPRLVLVDRNMTVLNDDIQPQNDSGIRAAIEDAL